MKVKELIEKLQEIDPNAEVVTTTSNFEMGNNLVRCSRVRVSKNASRKLQTFTDAFDGVRYQSETWSTVGGDLTVVEIC